ncbi:MAG: aminotransferase class V-fold PLP-dependent enzyme [Pseudomonadota bacterium]
MREVYLNNAGHGHPIPAVLARQIAHLQREAEVGPDRAKAEAADELDQIWEAAGALIGGDPARTALITTTCATWYAAVSRLALDGKRVLVAPHEWYENLEALEMLAHVRGLRIEVLPEIDFADPDLTEWANRIDDETALICFPLVTSMVGHRYPLEAIGKLARPEGCAIAVDAAQSFGQMPLDLEASGVDIVVGTARKWIRGPRQTGLLWIREGLEGINGPLTARTLEPHDAHIATRLGLGAALEESRRIGISEVQNRLGALSDKIRAEAAALSLPCLSARESGTTAITIALPKASQPAIAKVMADHGVIAKWPVPGMEEPKAAEGQTDRALLRISPHLANTSNDIGTLFTAIAQGLAAG